jgi:hypothetical protein
LQLHIIAVAQNSPEPENLKTKAPVVERFVARAGLADGHLLLPIKSCPSRHGDFPAPSKIPTTSRHKYGSLIVAMQKNRF